jgi:hypothetical protein
MDVRELACLLVTWIECLRVFQNVNTYRQVRFSSLWYIRVFTVQYGRGTHDKPKDRYWLSHCKSPYEEITHWGLCQTPF